MTYHQDGILDLVIGFMILIFATVNLLGQVAFIGLIAIPGSLYIPLKQKITFPRLGFIRFNAKREQQRKLSLALILGLVALLGLVVAYILVGDLPDSIVNGVRENIFLLFGGVFGLVLCAAAYFLKNSRFYFYALVAVILIWSANFMGIRLGVPIAILGGIVEGVGLIFMFRFYADYPIESES
jgi:hypothetical protein